jgi:hypothetical protein
MTFEQEWFTTYECISPRKVFMGDDTVLEAINKGNIKATMQVGGEFSHTTITQVLHVLKMKNNLIFISKFISESFKVEFDKDATMPMESLRRKHGGRKTYIFSTSMFERRQMWQSLQLKELLKIRGEIAHSKAHRSHKYVNNTWRESSNSPPTLLFIPFLVPPH